MHRRCDLQNLSKPNRIERERERRRTKEGCSLFSGLCGLNHCCQLNIGFCIFYLYVACIRSFRNKYKTRRIFCAICCSLWNCCWLTICLLAPFKEKWPNEDKIYMEMKQKDSSSSQKYNWSVMKCKKYILEQNHKLRSYLGGSQKKHKAAALELHLGWEAKW